jgi:hypothetical protein
MELYEVVKVYSCPGQTVAVGPEVMSTSKKKSSLIGSAFAIAMLTIGKQEIKIQKLFYAGKSFEF